MPEPVDFTTASQVLSLVPDAACDTRPSQLSQGAYRALRQLERRMRTGELDAVNIRHVQELAVLGLAHHGRGGWRPTNDGLNYLGKHRDRNGPD